MTCIWERLVNSADILAALKASPDCVKKFVVKNIYKRILKLPSYRQPAFINNNLPLVKKIIQKS